MLTLLLLACTSAPSEEATPEEEPFPDLGLLPAFSLVDQDGAAVTRDSLSGNVLVVDFIFTSCPNICPRLTALMGTAATRWKGEPNLRFLSFTVDPETDTPPVLKAYAAQYGADPKQWSFLTGPPAEVRAVVVDGMKQVMEDIRIDGQGPPSVLHGERFVLVDKRGHLRGFPDPHEPEMETLSAGVHALLREGT